jgi:mRNA-degrading endonuclease RelE of RelBE toxin-antitoxin system
VGGRRRRGRVGTPASPPRADTLNLPARRCRPLAADPHQVGKPLRFDLEGFWSARRGQDRVVYSIHEDRVLVRVVRISHRADVYG